MSSLEPLCYVLPEKNGNEMTYILILILMMIIIVVVVIIVIIAEKIPLNCLFVVQV